MRKWLKSLGVTRRSLQTNRFLRPVAHWLAEPSIWHINRRSVARGTAVGLFCAFVIPVGQIMLAAVISVVTRSNLLIASVATLVCNPLTMTPIYYLAYKVGRAVLGPIWRVREALEDEPVAGSLLRSLSDATLYTACGLLIFAVVSAALGYILVNGLWWASVAFRLRRRSAKQNRLRAQ